jgi:putative flippase GtrA
VKPERDTRGQFIRYLIAGLCNTGFTYALLIFAMRWIDDLLAYSIVYVLGIAVGYGLQSRFVFRVPIDWRSAARFPAVYLVQYAVGASILWMLIHTLYVSPRVAALCAIAANVPTGFWMSRLTLAGSAAPTRHD